MEFKVKKYEELTAAQLYEIMRARAEIFVVEQDCVYQDCDDCDYEYHVFATEKADNHNGFKVTAYLRLYTIKESPKTAQMGRVLTIEHGKGLGGKLLEEGIKVAKNVMKAECLFLESEIYVIGFYEKAGLKVTSGEYLKDGIPHKDMELWL